MSKDVLVRAKDESVDNKRLISGLAVIFGLIISIGFLALVVYIISLILQNPSVPQNLSKYLPTVELAPEPVERAQYILGLLFFPFALIASTLAFNKMLKPSVNINIEKTYFAISRVLVLLMLGLTLLANKQNDYFYISNNYFFQHPLQSIPLFALVLLAVWLSQRAYLNSNNRSIRILNVSLDLLAVIIVVWVCMQSIFNIYNIDDTWTYVVHFSGVFYSVVQVYYGKALLIDSVSHYGLFPQFIEPIFKVFGLSILKFASLMTLFLSISFLAIYGFLRSMLKNRIVAFVGFIGLLFLNFAGIKILLNSDDPYFQYHPIRFIFPTLAIYLTWKYFSTGNKKLYYLSFVLYSIGFLWNPDTGLVVFGAWLIALCFSELKNFDKEALIKILTHIAIGIGIFLITMLTFTFYMKLRYGSFPAFAKFFTYQSYFYKDGAFMLPMTLIHPWVIVILVYISGLALGVRSILAKAITPKTNIVLFLSILGVGVFSYYQGRSHDYNLVGVWYPALILLIIYADDLVQNIQNKGKDIVVTLILFTAIMYFFTSSFFSLLIYYPEFYSNRVQPKITTKVSTPVIRNGNFIKDHVGKDKKTVILSQQAGVYHLMSKTASALNTPVITEIFLKEDIEKINEFIATGKSNKVFVDKSYQINKNEALLKSVNSKYKVVGVSDDKDMLLFERFAKYQDQPGKSSLGPLGTKSLIHYTMLKGDIILDQERKLVGFKDTGKSLDLRSSFTVELMVKPARKQATYANIVGNHPGINYEGFVVQQDGKKHNVYAFGYGDGKKWLPNASFRLSHSKWNYLIITVKEGLINVYNNGKRIASVDAKKAIKNSDMPLSIGDWSGLDRPFKGEIKEVRISNNIPEDKTINRMYKKHVPPR